MPEHRAHISALIGRTPRNFAGGSLKRKMTQLTEEVAASDSMKNRIKEEGETASPTPRELRLGRTCAGTTAFGVKLNSELQTSPFVEKPQLQNQNNINSNSSADRLILPFIFVESNDETVTNFARIHEI